MRRIAALLIVTLLAAVPLAACGSSKSNSLPTVTGAPGAQPTVVAPDHKPAGSLQSNVISAGAGQTIAKGDLVVVNYLGQTWDSNKVFDSSWNHGAPVGFKIGVDPLIKGWVDGLVGKKAGSRVLLVVPPSEGYGSQGYPDAGIKANDTLVFVIDVLGVYNGKTVIKGDGKAASLGSSLPNVTGASDKKPAISIPSGVSAPSKLVAQPVIPGPGAAIKKGQTVVVQYAGVLWRNGKQFDSSWDRKAPVSFQLDPSAVIKGWADGLVGQKVGSRVLLIIPPADGYGSQGQPSAGIKGTDTLVFAVDILDAL